MNTCQKNKVRSKFKCNVINLGHSVGVNTLYKDLLCIHGLSRTIHRLGTWELVGYGPVQLRLKRLKVNPAIGSSHQQISWLITSLFPVTLLAPHTSARANSSQGLFLNYTHFGLHSPIKLSIWYICTWKATPATANRVRFCDEKGLNMLQMNTSTGQSKRVWNHIFSCGTFWNRISNSQRCTAAARWVAILLGLSTALRHTELAQQLLDGLL